MSMNYEHLCGWAGKNKVLLAEAQSSMPEEFKQDINILHPHSRPDRMMLFEVVKKVLGHYPPLNTQLIGDCVSWGGHKNPIEYLQLCQIAMGNPLEFKYIYSPYGYGCGRVYVGAKELPRDGSIGAWAAEANIIYGSIPIDLAGLPAYSSEVAREFGSSSKALDKWVNYGKSHIIKSSARVSTWEELTDSITNLYPISVCSSVGFSMHAKSDGFHRRGRDWNHCMCIIGVDNSYPDPYACVLNSWGDVHGIITDFLTGEEWPRGTLRISRIDAECMIEQGDSFAYSGYEGFESQSLPEDFFDMI